MYELDGRYFFPDGLGPMVGSEPNRYGATWGGLTVRGPLSYFGGGTQDILKISAQGAGNGAVVLAMNADGTEYEPLNLRGETITFQIKTSGTSSYPAGGFDAAGDFYTLHGFKPHGAISFEESASYVRVNATHGLRFNNAADTANLITIEDDGRLRIHALAGGGTRTLKVDNNGYVCV